MRINDVRVDQYRIPLPTPLTDSTHGEMTHFEVVTVRLRCDGGEEGLGYSYTIGRGGRAIRALLEIELVPFLIGKDPRRIEQLWDEMWWLLHYVGRGGIVTFAISAIDIALWDMKGRVAGEPLYRMLGGDSDRVMAYNGGIDLHMSAGELVEHVKDLLHKGFRAIKIKMGRKDLSEDIERVAAVRNALGSDIPLMVDANMALTVEEAIRAAQALSDYDVYWFEEPTIPDDVEGHVRVLREGGVPIATGENLHTIYEFQNMMAAGAVSFPEPDVSNIGGVTAWMKVARMAEGFKLPVTSHGVQELHVHLLAAVPNASYLEAHGFVLTPFLRHPLEMQDGCAIAPDRPGHGVEFDWDALEPHRVVERDAG